MFSNHAAGVFCLIPKGREEGGGGAYAALLRFLKNNLRVQETFGNSNFDFLHIP